MRMPSFSIPHENNTHTHTHKRPRFYARSTKHTHYSNIALQRKQWAQIEGIQPWRRLLPVYFSEETAQKHHIDIYICPHRDSFWRLTVNAFILHFSRDPFEQLCGHASVNRPGWDLRNVDDAVRWHWAQIYGSPEAPCDRWLVFMQARHSQMLNRSASASRQDGIGSAH